MKIIIDGDHISYRSAASCSPTKNKPHQEGLEEAIWRAESMYRQIQLDLNSDDCELYISGEGNWRYAIFPEYKANRKDQVKPLWLQEVREHLLLKYKAEIVNDKEVDDICGIRLTQEALQGNADTTICASLDKDLLTVPGWHYSWETRGATWVKPAKRVLVSPYDALRNFYKQVITGDGADGVPAFDGKMRSATPQFVQKLLDPLDSMTEEYIMWQYVLDVYEEHRLPQEDWEYADRAVRNASVLHIQTSEGSMWQPPKNGHQHENIPS